MKTLNYFKKNIKISHGFTLVETLVAISILTLSILAGFTAVNNGLKSSLTAKNQMTAFYLVQEAVEMIKNKRDDNALDFINGGTSSWATGMFANAGDACFLGQICYVDPLLKTFTSCAGTETTCPNLNIQTSTGLWGYTATPGWVATNFKRAIKFEIMSADEVKVTVWISWTEGASTKTFTITEIFFNRQQ